LVAKPELSVVIPCYNEEENAANIAAAVIAEMEKLTSSFDIVFIDNGSADRTVEIIKGLCAADGRIKLIANTRNFGQMRSPSHAVFEAHGKAIIGISADFEDPPAMIPQFVERWRAGVDIVLGVRKTEKMGTIHGALRDLYYWFTARFGDYQVIPNVTGFGIYDGKTVDAIRKLVEPEPFFRGLLIETGYTVEIIPYDRPRRQAGLSSNTFFTLLDFALSSLASFAKKLVRIPIYIGILTGLLGGVALIGAIYNAIAGQGAMGWLFAAMIEFQLGLLFIFLGLIGDQVRLISERTRQTPLVFERERINFPDDY